VVPEFFGNYAEVLGTALYLLLCLIGLAWSFVIDFEGEILILGMFLTFHDAILHFVI
jgi:hypothetical protein